MKTSTRNGMHELYLQRGIRMRIQELYDELCGIIIEYQNEGMTGNDTASLFSRLSDVDENLGALKEEELSAEEVGVFKKAWLLDRAFWYALRYSWKCYINTPGISVMYDDMTSDRLKKYPDIMQKTNVLGRFSESTSAKINGAKALFDASDEEDILESINELRQAFKEPDSDENKELVDFARSFIFEETGDVRVDYFLEWCSLIGNQDAYRLFLNEKILEYFRLYYQKIPVSRPFYDFAESSCDGQASVPIEKLHAFVKLDTNFMYMGYTINDTLFEAVFLNEPYVLSEDDYSFFQGCVAVFSEKQLMQQNWVFACLFQSLKKVNDSEFRNLFNDGNGHPVVYDEIYADVVQKYGFTSELLALEKEAEEVQIQENVEVAFSRTALFKELLFFFGVWELYAGNKTAVDRLYAVFTSGDKERMADVFDCLNETASCMGMKRDDGRKPFIPFDSEFSDISSNSFSSVLSHAIYTLKNYHSDTGGFILNEMNFIEKQQEELFSVITGKEKYFVREYGNDEKTRQAAAAEWREKSHNRKKLAAIDCGWNLEFRQNIPFFGEELMYLDRKMKCRYFSIPDKKFSYDFNRFGSDKNNSVCYQIRYDENYRVSNRNNLTSIYLQLIRNIETHFALHHSVDSLLNDKFSKKHFLEAFLDCLQFAGTIVDNDPDPHHKTAAEFMVRLLAETLNRICIEAFSEEDVVGKPFLKLLFTDDFSAIADDVLDKVEKVKFTSFPEYVQTALQKILNWFYGIENDFLDRNRFNVTFYLIYLSFALYNEQK